MKRKRSPSPVDPVVPDAKRRKTAAPAPLNLPTAAPAATHIPSPARPPIVPPAPLDTRRVVFVLGGPGSGKGTQCQLMVKRGGFCHFSAGELLRGAAKEDNDRGRMIQGHLDQGTIVPGHVTISLLKEAIMGEPASQVCLIDGFPREMVQCVDFERDIVPCEFMLFLECGEDEMCTRLLKRGVTSGRTDDREGVIKKRFATYRRQTLPVREYFEGKGKLRCVSAERSREEVHRDVCSLFGC